MGGVGSNPVDPDSGSIPHELQEETWARVDAVNRSCRANRCAHYALKFRHWVQGMPPLDKADFWMVTRSGIDNARAKLGCFAMQPNDYKRFNKFFDPLIREYHNADEESYHVSDWAVPDAANEGRPLDLGADVAVRARASRNLAAFPLPGAMAVEDRVAFERALLPALEALVADPAFGGRIYSLTPHGTFGLGGNPYLVTRGQHRTLVAERVMFEDVAADPHLARAGIAAGWPAGRGAWASADGRCVVWYGRVDHLRAMVAARGRGAVLAAAFARLRRLLDAIEGCGARPRGAAAAGFYERLSRATGTDTHGADPAAAAAPKAGAGAGAEGAVVELVAAAGATTAAAAEKEEERPEEEEAKKPLKFATNDEYGYVTSCPSNLGTALRASVRLRPAPGVDAAAARDRCGRFGLSVTAVGDGTLDLSPTARLFVKEGELIASLFRGAKALLVEADESDDDGGDLEEKAAAAATPAPLLEEKG